MELKDCTFGEHFQFPPHVEEDALGVKLLFKAAVTSYDSVSKEIDEMVIREIVKAAQDNGVADLTVLNRKFILEALKEKWDRINGKENATSVKHCKWIPLRRHRVSCSNCGFEGKDFLQYFNYCPGCGAKAERL